jgi:hypothetical protein
MYSVQGKNWIFNIIYMTFTLQEVNIFCLYLIRLVPLIWQDTH